MDQRLLTAQNRAHVFLDEMFDLVRKASLDKQTAAIALSDAIKSEAYWRSTRAHSDRIARLVIRDRASVMDEAARQAYYAEYDSSEKEFEKAWSEAKETHRCQALEIQAAYLMETRLQVAALEVSHAAVNTYFNWLSSLALPEPKAAQ
jgi:hypothetical protein